MSRRRGHGGDSSTASSCRGRVRGRWASRRRAKSRGRWSSPATASSTRSSASTTTPGSTRKGKIVVVRRFVPETPSLRATDRQRRFGDLRYKAWIAREHGREALLVVDWPSRRPAGATPTGSRRPRRACPPAARKGYGDAGIPVVVVKRAALAPLIAKLTRGRARRERARGRGSPSKTPSVQRRRRFWRRATALPRPPS